MGNMKFSTRDLEIHDGCEDHVDHGLIDLHSKIIENMMKSSIGVFNFPLGMEITLPYSCDLAHVCHVGFLFAYLAQFRPGLSLYFVPSLSSFLGITGWPWFN